MENLAVDIFDKCLGLKLKTPFPRLSSRKSWRSTAPTSRTCGSGWKEIVDVNRVAVEIHDAGVRERGRGRAPHSGDHLTDAANPKPGGTPAARSSTREAARSRSSSETSFGQKLYYTKYEGGASRTGVSEPRRTGSRRTEPAVRPRRVRHGVVSASSNLQEAMGFVRARTRERGAEAVPQLVGQEGRPRRRSREKARAEDGPRSRSSCAGRSTSSGCSTSRCSGGNEEKKSAAICATRTPRQSTKTLPHFAKNEELGEVTTKAYDMVLNGYEVGGGSIRIHRQDVQSRVFEILEHARPRRGEEPLRYCWTRREWRTAARRDGLRLDHSAMILAGTTNIRDVILGLPKNRRRAAT